MIAKAKPASASAAEGATPVGAKFAAKKSAKNVPTKSTEVSGKLGKVVALLKRSRGTTVAELMKATGWQAHSVRGAISGSLKKKHKLTVLSEKVGNVRTYRIKG